MNNDEEKKCIICTYLNLEKERCPTAPIEYSCSTINSLIYSSRKLTLKLEKLDKFYCNFFKKDIRKRQA